ncbi:MAG: cobalamin-dependent protein [Rhodobacteraceae bacterium]|nr:cobalamin-dependent protein [Paracoccaceae bacterium]
MSIDQQSDSRIRVMLAKPTHDCHDRGVRLVARKMRDAGFEVIFCDFLVPSEIITNVVEEDVDVLGVSCSSGGHMPIFEDLVAAFKDLKLDDLFLIGGGVIPEDDVTELKEMGIKAVFGPGTSPEDAIEMIKQEFAA